MSLSPHSTALPSDLNDRMIRFAQRLIQTPSPAGAEQEVAALIRRELDALGLDGHYVDDAGNVICLLRGQAEGPMLLFDAHMDTVAVTETWSHDPLAGEIDGALLFGLGACDAKAAIAAMTYAAAHLQAGGRPRAGSLCLAFVVQGEQCEGVALKHVVESGLRPDYVLLGEPSDLSLIAGHRGRMLFRAEVQGRGAHASMPQLGSNAILAAARVIFGVDILSVDMQQDPALGPGSIAVTHIESAAASLNAIPSRCLLTIDRRLTLGESARKAQAELDKVLTREGVSADFSVVQFRQPSYTGYPFEHPLAFNPWVLDAAHPFALAALEAITPIAGSRAVMSYAAFSTDGVYSMGEQGIPTLGFGPGKGDHAHTPDDQVRLADITLAAQGYAAIAARLLG